MQKPFHIDKNAKSCGEKEKSELSNRIDGTTQKNNNNSNNNALNEYGKKKK